MKKITVYELIKLVASDKPPKRIIFDNKVWIYKEQLQDYQSDGLYLFTRITEKYDKWLNAIIEIIKE